MQKYGKILQEIQFFQFHILEDNPVSDWAETAKKPQKTQTLQKREWESPLCYSRLFATIFLNDGDLRA